MRIFILWCLLPMSIFAAQENVRPHDIIRGGLFGVAWQAINQEGSGDRALVTSSTDLENFLSAHKPGIADIDWLDKEITKKSSALTQAQIKNAMPGLDAVIGQLYFYRLTH